MRRWHNTSDTCHTLHMCHKMTGVSLGTTRPRSKGWLVAAGRRTFGLLPSHWP